MTKTIFFILILCLSVFSLRIFAQTTKLPKAPKSVLGVTWGMSPNKADAILRERGMEYVITEGTPPFRAYHGGKIGEYNIYLSNFYFSESKGFYSAVLAIDTIGGARSIFENFLTDLKDKYGKSRDTSYGSTEGHSWMTGGWWADGTILHEEPFIAIDFIFNSSDRSIMLMYYDFKTDIQVRKAYKDLNKGEY